MWHVRANIDSKGRSEIQFKLDNSDDCIIIKDTPGNIEFRISNPLVSMAVIQIQRNGIRSGEIEIRNFFRKLDSENAENGKEPGNKMITTCTIQNNAMPTLMVNLSFTHIKTAVLVSETLQNFTDAENSINDIKLLESSFKLIANDIKTTINQETGTSVTDKNDLVTRKLIKLKSRSKNFRKELDSIEIADLGPDDFDEMTSEYNKLRLDYYELQHEFANRENKDAHYATAVETLWLCFNDIQMIHEKLAPPSLEAPDTFHFEVTAGALTTDERKLELKKQLNIDADDVIQQKSNSRSHFLLAEAVELYISMSTPNAAATEIVSNRHKDLVKFLDGDNHHSQDIDNWKRDFSYLKLGNEKSNTMDISNPVHRLYAKSLLGLEDIDWSEIQQMEATIARSKKLNDDKFKKRQKQLVNSLVDDKVLSRFGHELDKQIANIEEVHVSAPISEMDLRSLLFFSSIKRGSPSNLEIAQRYIVSGTSEDISIPKMMSVFKARFQFERNFKILMSIIVERLADAEKYCILENDLVREFTISEFASDTEIQAAARKTASQILAQILPNSAANELRDGKIVFELLEYNPQQLLDMNIITKQDIPHLYFDVSLKCDVEFPKQRIGIGEKCVFLISPSMGLAKSPEMRFSLVCIKSKSKVRLFEHHVRASVAPIVRKPMIPSTNWYQATTWFTSTKAKRTLLIKCVPCATGTKLLVSWSFLWDSASRSEQPVDCSGGEVVLEVPYPDLMLPSLESGIRVTLQSDAIEKGGCSSFEIKQPALAKVYHEFREIDHCFKDQVTVFVAFRGGIPALSEYAAATRIAANFRGHQARDRVEEMKKKVQVKIELKDLLKINDKQQMSTILRAFQGDALVGESSVSSNSGPSPTCVGTENALQLQLINTQTDIRVVVEELIPDYEGPLAQIGSFIVPLKGKPKNEWCSLQGNIRGFIGSGLKVFIDSLKFFGTPNIADKLEFKLSAGARNPKQASNGVPFDNKANKGLWSCQTLFVFDAELRAADVLWLRIMANDNAVPIAECRLPLTEFIRDGKWNGWVKLSDIGSVNIRCAFAEVKEKHCGSYRIQSVDRTMKVAESPAIAESALISVKVLQAENILEETGPDFIQPYVSMKLEQFPCEAKTDQCWSNGTHAKWTKYEKNLLQLPIPRGYESAVVTISIRISASEMLDTLELSIKDIEALEKGPLWFTMQHAKIQLSARVIDVAATIPQVSDQLKMRLKFEPSIAITKPKVSEATEETCASKTGAEIQGFFSAIRKSKLDQANILIAKNKDLVNSRNSQGITALHFASRTNNSELARWLLSNGANLNAEDSEGKTAVQVAKSLHMVRLLGGLVPHSIQVSAKSQLEGLENLQNVMNESVQGKAVTVDMQVTLFQRFLKNINGKTNPVELFQRFLPDESNEIDIKSFEEGFCKLIELQTPSKIERDAMDVITLQLFGNQKTCALDRFVRSFGFEENASVEFSPDLVKALGKYHFDTSVNNKPSNVPWEALHVTPENVSITLAKLNGHENITYRRIVESFLYNLEKQPGRINLIFDERMNVERFGILIVSNCGLALSDPGEGFLQRFCERVRARLGLSDTSFSGLSLLKMLREARWKCLRNVAEEKAKYVAKLLLERFSSNKKTLSATDILEMYKGCDVDQDGIVDFSDFESVLQNYGVEDCVIIQDLFSTFAGAHLASRISKNQLVGALKRFLSASLVDQGTASSMLTQKMEPIKNASRDDIVVRHFKASVLEVNWSAFVSYPSKIQYHITEYAYSRRILVSDKGVSLRLGLDRLDFIGNRDMKWNTTTEKELQALNLLLAKIHGWEDSAARLLQSWVRQGRARNQARGIFHLRQAYKLLELQQNQAATKIQSRYRTIRTRRKRHQIAKGKRLKNEQFRAREKQIIMIQSLFRGGIVRMDLMTKRKTRMDHAAVVIQSIVRGYVVRSESSRQNKREIESIVNSLRERVFRTGFKARVSVNAPRAGIERLNLNVLFPPFREVTGDRPHQFLYGLEASASSNRKFDENELREKFRYVLKCFGIQDATAELGTRPFGESSSGDFYDSLSKTMLDQDESHRRILVHAIANEISVVSRVHEVANVENALQNVLKDIFGKNDAQVLSFRNFRYLRSNIKEAHCWIDRPDSAVYSGGKTRSLEQAQFREHATPVAALSQVKPFVLAAQSMDLFGLAQAFFDKKCSIPVLRADSGVISSEWNGIRYDIAVTIQRESTDSSKSLLAKHGLCKSLNIDSILMSSLDSKLDSHSKYPVELTFFEMKRVNVVTVLQSSSWLPPVDSKPFEQFSYSGSIVAPRRSVANESKKSTEIFVEVRWYGRLRYESNGEVHEDVVVVNAIRQASPGAQHDLRLNVGEEPLGWFSLEKCRKILVLDLKVELGNDDTFHDIVTELARLDQGAHILTQLLQFVRKQIGENIYTTFVAYSTDEILSKDQLRVLLIAKCEAIEFLMTKTLDLTNREEFAGTLLRRFLNLFSDHITFEEFSYVMHVPSTSDWNERIRRLINSKSSSILYLRAKFSSLAKSSSFLPTIAITKVLSEFFENESLDPVMLNEKLTWTSFADPLNKNMVEFKKWLDSMKMPARSSTAIARTVSRRDAPTRALVTQPALETVSDVSDSARDDLDSVRTQLDDYDLQYFSASFLQNPEMVHALLALRCAVSDFASTDEGAVDFKKAFEVFDRDGNGFVELNEWEHALKWLGIKSFFSADSDIIKFIEALDQDGDGRISLAEFKAVMGNNLKPRGTLQAGSVKTIRWEVELYDMDTDAWVKGVAKLFREDDEAVEVHIRKNRHASSINMGFLRLSDHPIFLRRNLWQGKPWGRDPLWRTVLYSRENLKRAIKDSYRSAASGRKSEVSGGSTHE